MEESEAVERMQALGFLVGEEMTCLEQGLTLRVDMSRRAEQQPR